MAAPWWRGLSGRETVLVVCGALAAAAAVALIAAPALWYVGRTATGLGRHVEIVAALAGLTALDARWERDALRMLNDPSPPPPASTAAAPAGVPKTLGRLAKELDSPALQGSVTELARAFDEKAALVARFEQAHASSREALREALAMEAEIVGLLREAWRDAPDRQRLVAADNVVTQLFADIQRYYFAPAESTRRNLEASIADLRGAAEALPAGVKAAATRLQHHITDLLRARPQEHAAYDRLRHHHAGPRAATLARELLLELEQDELRRMRHRAQLAAYFHALLVLVAYLAARLIRRELARRKAGPPPTIPSATAEAPIEPALGPPGDSTPGP